MNDSIAVLGAHFENSSTGSAYIFRYNGNTWTEEQRVLSDTPGFFCSFGYDVEIDEGDIYISSPVGIVNGARIGAIYKFAFNTAANSWYQTTRIANDDLSYIGDFGSTIAIFNGQVLGGQPYYQNNTGRALFFTPDIAIQCPASPTLPCGASLSDFTNQITVLENCSQIPGITYTQTPLPGTILNNSVTVAITAQNGDGSSATCNLNIPVGINYYDDLDNDGFGNPNSTPVLSCFSIPGKAPNNQDCNDNNRDIYPNAPEICDGLDNNCSGTADEGLTLIANSIPTGHSK